MERHLCVQATSTLWFCPEDQRFFVMVDLLTHRLDFLIEILDTLHQLRARARSCSGFKWSRLGSEVMPPILQIACVDSIEAKQLNFT